jgi:hypothetical protein
MTENAEPYWLHLGRHAASGVGTTYTVARTNSTRWTGEGGACPTVHYASWEDLLKVLRNIKIPEATIEETGNKLKQENHYILQDIYLTNQQLKEMGFPDFHPIAVPGDS